MAVAYSLDEALRKLESYGIYCEEGSHRRVPKPSDVRAHAGGF